VRRGNAFNREIAWLQIDIGSDDHNHLVSPEDRFKLAMARQRPPRQFDFRVED
jgi:arylsulfatase